MQIFVHHKTFPVLLAGIVASFIFHFMTNTYVFQMVQAVGGDSRDMGLAASIAAVCEIPVMFFFSRIVRHISARTLLRVAGVGWFLKALAFCFCRSVAQIYLAETLQLLGFGIFIPASVYYANQIMDEGSKVKGQAMLTVGAVCAAVGVVLFFVGTTDN